MKKKNLSVKKIIHNFYFKKLDDPRIKKKLFALGAKFASLSGSGSTVFGIFDDNVKVKKAFSHFSPMHKTYIAHSL